MASKSVTWMRPIVRSPCSTCPEPSIEIGSPVGSSFPREPFIPKVPATAPRPKATAKAQPVKPVAKPATRPAAPAGSDVSPGAPRFAGTVLFSGSLYALALTGVTRFGLVTPFGGLSLLAGWLVLAWGLARR